MTIAKQQFSCCSCSLFASWGGIFSCPMDQPPFPPNHFLSKQFLLKASGMISCFPMRKNILTGNTMSHANKNGTTRVYFTSWLIPYLFLGRLFTLRSMHWSVSYYFRLWSLVSTINYHYPHSVLSLSNTSTQFTANLSSFYQIPESSRCVPVNSQVLPTTVKCLWWGFQKLSSVIRLMKFFFTPLCERYVSHCSTATRYKTVLKIFKN